MRGFFNLDSPFMRFLSRMADLMILNILVLITCIPVITIGASLTAMHYVLIKMIRDEETYITKMYFKSFKENFLQATLLWIIVAVVGGIFAVDWLIFTRSGHEFSMAFMVAVLGVAVLFCMTVMYIWPLQARFVNTVGKTLKNSFLIMILNFPKSLLMIVLYGLPVLLFFISDYAVPFLILFGVSVPGLGAAYLYRKVFSRFEPEAEALTDDMDFHVEGVDDEVTEEVTEEVTDEIPGDTDVSDDSFV